MILSYGTGYREADEYTAMVDFFTIADEGLFLVLQQQPSGEE
jgi:hypothetical protein